jgi:CRP/FNR family cyclic AMP-dependent transcriptional regulator
VADRPFLSALSDEERNALLASGHPRSWPRGEVLLRTGELADHAIVITEGFVKVSRSTPEGAEVILSLSGPGDLLGEPAAFRGAKRSADATALEPVTGTVVSVPDLRGFLRTHPQATLTLLEMTLDRLHMGDARRIESATAGSLARVTGRLVELAERFGVPQPDGELQVALPMTQEELAAWSACSRESTARALRTLRDLRLIRTSRRAVTVHGLEALRAHTARS